MSDSEVGIRVEFFHNEQDNYQGGSIKTIKLSRVIKLPLDMALGSVHREVIEKLHRMGYNDQEASNSTISFSGRGIISIGLDV